MEKQVKICPSFALWASEGQAELPAIMNSEIKQCNNCGKEFTIEPEDFAFYEKIKVPPPTFCPECRAMRRLILRNERVLYNRKCDLCGDNIISIYSANKPFPVYCYKCWWGDKWDPLSFGRDFDFNKPFFEQYQELQKVVPRLGLFNINAVNSQYLNYAIDNKDCYMGSRVANSENCSYMYYCINGKDSLDCSYARKGELLYECFETRNCYNCYFFVDSENCMNCAYSYDLRNCSDCLFCSNLRSKQYCVENKQVSKEEFQKAWQETINGSRAKTKEARDKFAYLYQNQALHRCNKIIRCRNAQGVNLLNCKNVYEVYYATDSEDVRYGDDVETTRDAMDVKGPMHSELLYEVCSSDYGCARIFFSNFSERTCQDIFYSSFSVSSHDCFGSISLKNAEYCILNKKYPREDYLSLKERIIEYMKTTKEWGENFPVSISPFGYNETIVMEFFPLEREQAVAKGYSWENKTTGTFGKETIKQNEIPDNIKDVSDDIVEKILACSKCKRNYRLARGEFNLYQRLKLPIPEKCPECRYQERLFFRGPRKLWRRQCMCNGKTSAIARGETSGNYPQGLLTSDVKQQAYVNTTEHFHGDKPCPQEFDTTYALDRPEIVYCEECYKREVN